MSTCYMSGSGWGPQDKEDTGLILTILVSSIFLLTHSPALSWLCPRGCPAWVAPTDSLTLWPPLDIANRRPGQEAETEGG